MISQAILDKLNEKLPDFFPRRKVGEFTSGLLKSSYMCILDGEKQGPPRHYVGKRVFYIKEEFLAWLEEHMKNINPTKP